MRRCHATHQTEHRFPWLETERFGSKADYDLPHPDRPPTGVLRQPGKERPHFSETRGAIVEIRPGVHGRVGALRVTTSSAHPIYLSLPRREIGRMWRMGNISWVTRSVGGGFTGDLLEGLLGLPWAGTPPLPDLYSLGKYPMRSSAVSTPRHLLSGPRWHGIAEPGRPAENWCLEAAAFLRYDGFNEDPGIAKRRVDGSGGVDSRFNQRLV